MLFVIVYIFCAFKKQTRFQYFYKLKNNNQTIGASKWNILNNWMNDTYEAHMTSEWTWGNVYADAVHNSLKDERAVLIIQKFILKTIKIPKCKGIWWSSNDPFLATTAWTKITLSAAAAHTRMASSSWISALINSVAGYWMHRKWLLVPFLGVTSFTFQTYQINKLVHI